MVSICSEVSARLWGGACVLDSICSLSLSHTLFCSIRACTLSLLTICPPAYSSLFLFAGPDDVLEQFDWSFLLGVPDTPDNNQPINLLPLIQPVNAQQVNNLPMIGQPAINNQPMLGQPINIQPERCMLLNKDVRDTAIGALLPLSRKGKVSVCSIQSNLWIACLCVVFLSYTRFFRPNIT